jgi:hypothetical protein
MRDEWLGLLDAGRCRAFWGHFEEWFVTVSKRKKIRR